MRLRLSLALLLCSIAAFAGTVGRDRAEKAAMDFFGIAATRSGSPLTLVWDGETVGTKSASEPAFYVFDRAGGGFVIISGDDSVNPVLGYACSGKFITDGMPENLAGWMAELRSGILELRREGTGGRAPGWDDVTKAEAVVLHETALWNQREPYNRLCPKIMGDGTATGCVATALAIVMRWNRWPDAGTGTLPGYSYTDHNKNTQTVSPLALGHSYNWDQMPLSDLKNSGATDVQKKAVAQLIYDCGVMTQMQFDTDGSATVSTNVMETLPVYMKYDAGMTVEMKEYYSDEGWVSMVKKGLKESPLMYSAHSESGGGHAFVLAGYDSADNFYINWGWGGSDNGWYAFPAFRKFTESHQTFLGVRKDCGGEALPYLVAKSLKTNTGWYEVGQKFTLTASSVFNHGTGALTGSIAAGRLRKDGTLEIVSDEIHVKGLKFFHGYSSLNMSCKLPSEVKEGDRLGLFYRSDGQTQWRSVVYDVDAGGGMIALDGATDIGKATSVVWVVETRTLTVTSRGTATVELSSGSGHFVASGKGTLIVKDLPSGDYRLCITLGSAVKNLDIAL